MKFQSSEFGQIAILIGVGVVGVVVLNQVVKNDLAGIGSGYKSIFGPFDTWLSNLFFGSSGSSSCDTSQ